MSCKDVEPHLSHQTEIEWQEESFSKTHHRHALRLADVLARLSWQQDTHARRLNNQKQ
jgi:hypothetical protein